MKTAKVLILAIALFLISDAVQAQISRNTFMVGSQFGVSFNDGRSKVENRTIPGASGYDINFVPKMGYFFFDNLMGGLEIDFSYNKNKYYDDVVVLDGASQTSRSVSLLSGPFFRYYVPFVQNRAAVMAEASLGFGTAGNRSDGPVGQDGSASSTLFGWGFGPGLTFFATDRVALETVGKYSMVTSNTRVQGAPTVTNYVFNFDFVVGMNFYFGRTGL